MKTCSKCKEPKSPTEFYRGEKRCRTCCVKRAMEYKRRTRWGVTDYEERLAAQGGVCAICKGESGAKRNLAVDHDHDTGLVRGLLCGKCNTALGQLDEDFGRFREAAFYLIDWKKKHHREAVA